MNAIAKLLVIAGLVIIAPWFPLRMENSRQFATRIGGYAESVENYAAATRDGVYFVWNWTADHTWRS